MKVVREMRERKPHGQRRYWHWPLELMFRRQYIRSAQEQFGGQAGRDLFGWVDTTHPAAGALTARENRLEDSRRFHLALSVAYSGQRLPGRIRLALRSHQVQFGRKPYVITFTDQFVRGLLRLQSRGHQFEGVLSAARVKYACTTADTSAICALLRASSVDKYSSNAWSFRLRIRPKKSISQEMMPRLTLYCSEVIAYR